MLAAFFLAGFCVGFGAEWIHNERDAERQRVQSIGIQREELYKAMEQMIGDPE